MKNSCAVKCVSTTCRKKLPDLSIIWLVFSLSSEENNTDCQSSSALNPVFSNAVEEMGSLAREVHQTEAEERMDQGSIIASIWRPFIQPQRGRNGRRALLLWKVLP